MALSTVVSPPKPWERQAAESHAAVTQIATTPVAPVAPMYNAPSMGYSGGMGGYGYGASSSFGSGGYSSMYGGGGGGGYSGSYGGGAYGSSPFNSSYGRPYGGGGMMGPVGAPGNPMEMYKGTPINAMVNTGQTFISGVHQHVSSFGRFSQILHMNFEALHMSFSSVLQLLTNASLLRQEFSSFFGTFGSVRAIYVIYVKLQGVILRMLGRKGEAVNLEFDGLWKDTKQGAWGWMPKFLTLSFALWVAKRLIQVAVASRGAPQAIPDGSNATHAPPCPPPPHNPQVVHPWSPNNNFNGAGFDQAYGQFGAPMQSPFNGNGRFSGQFDGPGISW